MEQRVCVTTRTQTDGRVSRTAQHSSPQAQPTAVYSLCVVACCAHLGANEATRECPATSANKVECSQSFPTAASGVHTFLRAVEKPPPLAQPQHQDRAQRWSLRILNFYGSRSAGACARCVCTGVLHWAAVASATLCHVLRTGSEPRQKEQELHRREAAVVLLQEDLHFNAMYCCSNACTNACTNAGPYNAYLRSTDKE